MKTTRILIPATALLLAAGTALAWPGNRADTDGDGNISREEFMSMHEKMFDKMDANDDGQISAEERRKERMERYHDWKDKQSEDDE